MKRDTPTWTCDMCGKDCGYADSSVGMSVRSWHPSEIDIACAGISATMIEPFTHTEREADLCVVCAIRVGEKVLADLKARRK